MRRGVGVARGQARRTPRHGDGGTALFALRGPRGSPRCVPPFVPLRASRAARTSVSQQYSAPRAPTRATAADPRPDKVHAERRQHAIEDPIVPAPRRPTTGIECRSVPERVPYNATSHAARQGPEAGGRPRATPRPGRTPTSNRTASLK